jgi:sulfur carrier protein ThiS adenylyltransferase
MKEPEIYSANPKGISECLQGKTAFVAGAGGLGSNLAVCLARAGIGSLIVADFDRVEASNLNRQYFFAEHLEMPKVEALKNVIEKIGGNTKVTRIFNKLNKENFASLIPADVDIIFECFDRAEAKAELVRFCLTERTDIPLIAVSGIAGMGAVDKLKLVRKSEYFYLLGDEDSGDTKDQGTISSRVMAAAAMQAHAGINLLCGTFPS